MKGKKPLADSKPVLGLEVDELQGELNFENIDNVPTVRKGARARRNRHDSLSSTCSDSQIDKFLNKTPGK